MSEYKKPLNVDTTRYEQSKQVLSAMSTTDEYFADEKPEDPLVMIVDSLLATLPEDERACVEMVLMAGMSQHECAKVMGYINKSGKEDHKKVTRRLIWALRKLNVTLNSPNFATALTAHKLPIELPNIVSNDKILNIIQKLEIDLENDQSETDNE